MKKDNNINEPQKNTPISSSINIDDSFDSNNLSTPSFKKRIVKYIRRFLLTFFLTLILLLIGLYFFFLLIFKGPSTYMRDKSAAICLESSKIAFIPKLFLSDEEISNVVSGNRISYSSTTTTTQTESNEEGLEWVIN